jgi:hypothetical protein
VAEEHIFDRRTKAKTVQEQARQQVEQLIQKLRKAVGQLTDWPNVDFSGHDENGARFGPPPAHSDESTIRVDDVPSLLEIRAAILKWQNARGEVQAIEGNLTTEQRQTLGLPPR